MAWRALKKRELLRFELVHLTSERGTKKNARRKHLSGQKWTASMSERQAATLDQSPIKERAARGCEEQMSWRERKMEEPNILSCDAVKVARQKCVVVFSTIHKRIFFEMALTRKLLSLPILGAYVPTPKSISYLHSCIDSKIILKRRKKYYVEIYLVCA